MYDDHNVFCEKHTTWIIILYKDAFVPRQGVIYAKVDQDKKYRNCNHCDTYCHFHFLIT